MEGSGVLSRPFFVYTAMTPPAPFPMTDVVPGEKTLTIASSLIFILLSELASTCISLRYNEGVDPLQDSDGVGPTVVIVNPATFPCRYVKISTAPYLFSSF